MRKLRIVARAPSNIALIKYMGKSDSSKNLPDNPSLSMTLNSLCTVADVERIEKPGDHWLPEVPRFRPGDLPSDRMWVSPDLSLSGREKLLKHVERVREAVPAIYEKFGIALDQEAWRGAGLHLRTANTFPASSGIASSASSFAAVTLAVAASFALDEASWSRVWGEQPELKRALAQLSRRGSGSSCRSFEGPWVYWEGESSWIPSGIQLPEMAHFVILISTQPKQVSSSEAHLRIKTSPLWERRVERVRMRSNQLLSAMRTSDLRKLAQLAWTETWEMHSLFHTASEPFTYWEPGTVEALQYFSSWMGQESPPIVTLDAGPNVHVMVDSNDQKIWLYRLQEQFRDFQILEDGQGLGAKIEEWNTNGVG